MFVKSSKYKNYTIECTVSKFRQKKLIQQYFLEITYQKFQFNKTIGSNDRGKDAFDLYKLTSAKHRNSNHALDKRALKYILLEGSYFLRVYEYFSLSFSTKLKIMTSEQQKILEAIILLKSIS